MYRRRCRSCGEKYMPLLQEQKVCEECQAKGLGLPRPPGRPRTRKLSDPANSHIGYRAGRLGAISELRVVVDLYEKGWEVYRPVSGTAPTDLVALKGDRIVRLQVKTARLIKDRIEHKRVNAQHFDILALVIDGVVTYLPELEKNAPPLV